jgi:hypothetical protein
MDQAQLLSIIGSVYDKFVADVSARVESNLINMIDQSINVRIQEKIDGLTSMDKAFITDVVRSEIENADVDQQISDWMESNFDIDDHLDLKDKIDDYLSDRLSDLVKDEVRDLSFSVTVD